MVGKKEQIGLPMYAPWGYVYVGISHTDFVHFILFFFH